MFVRAVRGAITVDENSESDILASTSLLLQHLMKANDFSVDHLISIIFSTTKDLNAAFPAKAARQLGFDHVALLCCHEMDVPGALERCVRVLIHVNCHSLDQSLEHVYLKEAVCLRPEYSAKLDEDV